MVSKVAVLKTSPTAVIEDYARLMHLADYERFLPKENNTIIKLNLSWTLFYPACSTPPWQLEGVLKALRESGYRNIVAVENQTVVTHPWKGAYYNKWLPILRKYGVEFQPLTDVDWVSYKPKARMLAMNELFGDISIPRMFIGANVVHLPTVKTHGHTTTTGAMKNAFGGLIPKYRHHAHKRIHEVLVDLLAIQREIHGGIFAAVDGCVCGNGAGPRTMEPFVGNLIMASQDQVAVDAVAARIMGFEPSEIPYIRMAHQMGLGLGDTQQVELIGLDNDDLNQLDFGFRVSRSPVIRWDQILRKKTANIKWLHHILFHSPVFRAFILASELYHDRLWYPLVGKGRINRFLETQWGKLFEKYDYGAFPVYRMNRDWDPY